MLSWSSKKENQYRILTLAYFKKKPVGKRAGPIMRESLGIQRTKRAEEQKNTNQVYTLLISVIKKVDSNFHKGLHI